MHIGALVLSVSSAPGEIYTLLKHLFDMNEKVAADEVDCSGALAENEKVKIMKVVVL